MFGTSVCRNRSERAMSSRLRRNPEWVDQTLSRRWEKLSSLVEPSWLPVERGGVMQEYGCGAFGCALPTGDDKIVLKITTDMSEAAFASAALAIGAFPPGIVEYYLVLGLPDRYADKPVYLLWRQAADNVGALTRAGDLPFYYKTFGKTHVDKFDRLLWDYVLLASRLADIISDTREDRTKLLRSVRQLVEAGWQPTQSQEEQIRAGVYADHTVPEAEKFAYWLRRSFHAARELGRSDMGPAVGEALTFYMEHGMLISDAHTGNIGELRDDPSDEEDDGIDFELVITDPGMMVPLSPERLEIQVPLL